MDYFAEIEEDILFPPPPPLPPLIFAEPVRWDRIKSNDDECLALTGFTCAQFLYLFTLCGLSIPEAKKRGRGRRSAFGAHDRLLLVFCYLRSAKTTADLKLMFGISKSRAHTFLTETIQAISFPIYDTLVLHIAALIGPDEAVPEFPFARWVMDTRLQKIWIPCSDDLARIAHYSAEHQSYGIKTQTLHNRRGFVVHCVSGAPGSTNDVELAVRHVDQIEALFVRDQCTGKWRVLVDSAYDGIDAIIPVILPHRMPADGGGLTLGQEDYNAKHAGQHAVCQQWYKRLDDSFAVMAKPYRNDRADYARLFGLCAGLTNYLLFWGS